MYQPDFTVTPLHITPLPSYVPFDSFYLSSTHPQLRKVFSVQGPYPVIRAALWARGWVERRLPHPAQRPPHCHGDEEEDADDIGADVTGKKMIIGATESYIYLEKTRCSVHANNTLKSH